MENANSMYFRGVAVHERLTNSGRMGAKCYYYWVVNPIEANTFIEFNYEKIDSYKTTINLLLLCTCSWLNVKLPLLRNGALSTFYHR